VHGAGALRALVDAVGAESVVLGSDYPFDMGTTDPVSQVRAAGLTEAATRSILGDNAFRLGLSTASSGVQS
jgi:aminocarboxymuconate-semialdehyde decarboxylase